MTRVLALLLCFLSSIAGISGDQPLRAQPMTLLLEEQPLQEALEQFTEQSGATLVYGDALLEGIIVSANFRDRPAAWVLDRLIQGTPLKAKWTTDSRAVLHRLEDDGIMRVSGRVVGEQDAQPLAGVSVVLVGSARSTITDATGNFYFENVPRDVCSLQVAAEGFRPRQLTTDGRSKNWSPEIRLSLAASVMEEISVTGGLGQALTLSMDTGAIRIQPSGLAAQGAPATDLFESLKRMPGLDMQEFGDTGVSIRGSAPSENLVLLDGIKIYQTDHSLGYVSAINADAIGQIDIYKGAPPARYGERTAGVLDLGTRSLKNTRFSLDAGLEGDAAHLTTTLPLGRNAAIMISGRGSYQEGDAQAVFDRVHQSTFNEPGDLIDDDEEYVRSDRQLTFSDFIAKFDMRPTSKDLFSVTYYRGWDKTEEFVDVGETNAWLNIYNKRGRWGNEGTSITYRHDWRAGATTITASSSTLQNDFHGFYNDYFEEEPDPEEPVEFEIEEWHSDNDIEDEGIQLSHSFFTNTHQVELGLSSTKVSARYLFYDEVDVDLDDEAWVEENKLRAFYVQDTWQPTEHFGVATGLRLQTDDRTDSRSWDPRLNLWLKTTDHLTFRLGYGRNRQFILRSPDTLNYFEGATTWFVAEGDLVQPGESELAQVGFVYQKGNFLLESWAFRKEGQGRISKLFDPLGERPDIDQSKTKIEGAELFMRHRSGPLTLEMGYTWRKDRVISDLYSGERLNYAGDRDTPHQLKLAGYLQRGQWRWQAVWRYGSGRPYGVPEIMTREDYDWEFGDGPPEDYDEYEYDPDELVLAPAPEPNNLRLPSQHRLDVGLRYAFVWRGIVGEVGGLILNAYDRKNTLYRYYELEDDELLPVDVPGFGLKPVIDLRLRY